MRVLHVLPSLAPSYGGPSAALVGLSRALSARGIYSETVTTDLGNEEASRFNCGQLVEFNGVSVRYFPRLLASPLPRDFALSPQLAKWLKAHIKDYDILNIHGLFNYPNSVAAHIAYREGTPYVIRTCGMLDPLCLKQSRLKKNAYLKFFGDQMLRNATALSFTTQQEAEVSYKPEGYPYSVVIPLGVDTEDIPDKEGGSGCSQDKKIILFLSRLDPIKGLDLLLPALARLKKLRNDFLAVIAGGGTASYEAKIRTDIQHYGIENVVMLTGQVDRVRKWQLLNSATCFVLPSYHENFGLSVAEAMAVGCPVIISDQVNIHREVSDFSAGRVVQCDSEEICNALDDLLSDETMQRKMGLSGQHLVREKYSWDRVSGEVLSLYQKCIEQGLRGIK